MRPKLAGDMPAAAWCVVLYGAGTLAEHPTFLQAIRRRVLSGSQVGQGPEGLVKQMG